MLKRQTANGEDFEKLSKMELDNWGNGHFACSNPTKEEMQKVLNGEIFNFFVDNEWVWIGREDWLIKNDLNK